MKLIFVSGGVISGLGKGITASSIGRLLKSRGINVTSIKIDPYLNIDAGTMNPFEHGEVYVLDDGGEVDLDLGNYERFMDLHLGMDNNITTGKVYRTVIENERRGEYLGKTVQIIPHITNEIKRRITAVARQSGADVAIVELGGTVGDIESMPFLEAARQLGRDLGREENVMFIHTTLIPIMGSVGEEKSKPTQHSVRDLMSVGIKPDIIVGRCSRELSESAKAKIAMFCDVDENAVISCPDARSIYEVPLILERQGVADLIIDRMKLAPMTTGRHMEKWERFLDNIVNPSSEVTIALVGKYTALADSYLSQLEALTHAGAERCCHVGIKFVDSDTLLHGDPGNILGDVDGILVPGGFGGRGIEGMILAAKYARENNVPYFGICLGMQLLGRKSEEGILPGLGLIPFDNIRFRLDNTDLRVPHMGWDIVEFKQDSPLLKNLDGTQRYYFVHSYHAKCDNVENVLMTCDYGYESAAAVVKDNIMGVQSHPEKSHDFGMALLTNFVKEC